jgi:penicillin-binding protein 2
LLLAPANRQTVHLSLGKGVIRRNLVGLALVGVLLGACQGGPAKTTAPAAATPASPPAPTASHSTPAATAKPQASPTPPATAQDTAAAYLAAWQQGDYAGMYALLAPISQSTLSAAGFEKQYRDNLTIMSATIVTPTLTGASANGDSGEAKAHITYVTHLVGTLETDVTLPLQRAGGRWGVVFSPAVIWPDLVDGQKLYMVPFVPDRGTIYDRNGVPMVTQTDAVAIGLDPGEIAPDDDSTANGLSRLLGIPAADIRALYLDKTPGQYIAVGEASAAELARLSFVQNLAGVHISPFNARYYYGGGAAAQVTGYTVFIPPDKLADYQARGYSPDQRIGNLGLELWGENQLAGRNGGQLTLLDSAGKPLKALIIKQPTPSQDITTTIDFNLQKAAQAALGGYTAAAVAIRVDDGEVLALASSPTFDPNLFEPANLNRQFADNGAISAGLLNRAAQDAYPPGSVFKLVTFSAALTSGLFTSDSQYTCNGTWEELGPSLLKHDWKPDGHGKLTFVQGLSASCDPYFWHVGKALFDWNADWLPQVARAFGLGQPTGIDGIEETAGLIPDPTWKLQKTGQAWEVGDSLNEAIGQGDVQATPLQIARVLAAVGNNGILSQPQLVLKVAAPGQPPSYQFKPIFTGQLPLKPEQLAALQDGLHNVTQDPIGTARTRFRGLKIPVAGKTGTAETGQPDPHAWFAGYTFARRPDKPDIAIAVWVQNKGEGADVAAPIFRRILESYFGLPLTRYPWEESVGVVKTPEPTATPGGPDATPTP